MMLREDWAGVARDRMQAWEAEIRHQQLLRQIPHRPPRWRRWTGGSLVWVGRWLVRWGEWVTEPECRQEVSVVG